MWRGKDPWKKSAGSILRKACKNSSPRRSAALTAASGLLMFFGILLASFLLGKVRADLLRNQRENGSVAFAYVENGTLQTAENLKRFLLIRNMGFEKQYGRLFTNGMHYSDCSVMTEEDWKELKAPACSAVYGKFPGEANEIMMSEKTLEFLGIKEPQVGMTLSLEFYWKSILVEKEAGRQEFVLSGYYKDHTEEVSGSSISYIAVKKLEQAGIPMFPCRILMDLDSGLRNGEQTEQMLRDSFALADGESFVAEDSALYRSFRGIAGSFAAGIFLMLLLIFCTILMTGQLLNLSFLRDVRQYEQMETIGVTEKQIRTVFCCQRMWEILRGAVMGGIPAWIIARFLLPDLICGMYLEGEGSMDMLSIEVLPFAAVLGLTVCMSGFLISSARFRVWKNNRKKKGKLPVCRKGARLWKITKSFSAEMAGTTIRNSWRSFAVGVVVVSLGGSAALCAISLTDGTDLARKLERHPDVRTGITYGACDYLHRNSIYFDDILKTELYPEELLSNLESTARETGGTLDIRKGYFLDECDTVSFSGVDPEKDSSGSKERMISGMYRYQNEIPQAMMCMVSREEEKRLLKIGDAGRTQLETGEAVFVHKGMPLPEILTEGGKEVRFQVCDLQVPGTEVSRIHTEEVMVVEVLDLLKVDLSDLDLPWEEENVCWLLVSEETFQMFSENLKERILEVNLDVSEEKRKEAEETVVHYVEEANQRFRAEYGTEAACVSAVCRSELFLREKKYLDNSRFCMTAVCLVLFLFGFLLCFSTRYLDLVRREQERKLLRVLGATEKQLRRSLQLEGAVQGTAVMVLTAAVGNGAVCFLNRLVKVQSSVYDARFPWPAFCLLSVVLFLFQLLMPSGMLRTETKNKRHRKKKDKKT